jgi:hypothetical protein
MVPEVIHIFSPFSTYSSPSRRAVAAIFATSLPKKAEIDALMVRRDALVKLFDSKIAQREAPLLG